MSLVAGVDLSTQAVTVVLHDAHSGQVRGQGREQLPVTHPPISEQAPHLWVTAFQQALAGACHAADIPPRAIAAISVAGQCHGLVALDSNGGVIRPAKLWNDTTSAPQAAAMVAQLGMGAWADAVGSVPTAAFTITKLAWLAAHEPHQLRRIAHVLLPHDYLTFCLTGGYTTDRSEASGTGYFAAHEGRYRSDLLRQFVAPDLDWDSVLPQVCGPSQMAGLVSEQAGRWSGLTARIPVGPGAGDQHAAALGLGLRARDLLFSLGTSGVVVTTSLAPVHDHAGAVNGVADAAGGFLPLICTLNCTKVSDSFARLLGVTHDELAALALAAPTSARRPVLAAFFDGERFPNRPTARGVLAGIASDVSREQLALAVYEGVLFGLLAGVDAMLNLGLACDGRVVVAGGGARSQAYRQLLADHLGRQVSSYDAPEATARGAAVQAAAVLTGTEVTAVRDAWCPQPLEVRAPRGVCLGDARDRYQLVASWSGLDG